MAEKKLKVLEEAKEIATQPKQDEAERLIALAIEKKVPVETLEKLLNMRRELKEERKKENFIRAMTQFQAECPTIEKTKPGANKAYYYAPIEIIVEQIKPLLVKFGLTYSFTMQPIEGGVHIDCEVMHVEGASKHSPMDFPYVTRTSMMSETQRVAATVTMAKRYALMGAFGIVVGDEDTDGSTATNTAPKPLKPSEMAENLENDDYYGYDGQILPRPIVAAQNNTNSGRLLSDKQKYRIREELRRIGKNILWFDAKIQKQLHIPGMQSLTMSQAFDVIEGLIKMPNATKPEPQIDAPTDEIPFPDDAETDELIDAADAALTAKESEV